MIAEKVQRQYRATKTQKEELMTPIRTIIVDDHPDSLEILSFFVSQNPSFQVVAHCENGEDLIRQVMLTKPDLVIADINLPKLNGVDAIKKCISFQPHLKFIFVTGYEDFAVEAFNISAVDYIVKPVEMTRIYQALEKAEHVIRGALHTEKSPIRQSKTLCVKSEGSFYYIKQADVYFIEKAGKKCFIHTKNKTYEVYENIANILQTLGDQFYLSHRSNIINLEAVSHVTQKNETYLAFFPEYSKHAHISKLKIREFQKKMRDLNQ
ncbi:LytR/AlgR family response regulator transcription factor [Pseudobacillus badius]|uniref:LytR/AlgR family response regulator transcription factor n=1 Tax=Bacillus badius TaxID=1455 RepID=UPI001CBE9D5B|nr:response regulator transcription factor [Bacillus badius]